MLRIPEIERPLDNQCRGFPAHEFHPVMKVPVYKAIKAHTDAGTDFLPSLIAVVFVYAAKPAPSPSHFYN